ncbi:hypothetical protein [Aporhodopirellula aestuarii]|uniref:Uncharacterized protein n=1 Tax=Aporhodopirellula aestuarii TaxID=2950107 RepID=A0ABT0UDN9_9BACT|nr:hypothetical protein [Aporhodopirellula aestuarii]MCM2374844.1 hypothetical protein [Aporhodopirellula aestuarii]
MNIHYGMAAFLVSLTAVLGPFLQSQHAYGQNAQLASCGGPACGGSIYGAPAIGGACSSGGFSTLPYGGPSAADTAFLYESGYQGGGYQSPTYSGGGCGGTGYSGSGAMMGTGSVYSDGYTLGAASGSTTYAPTGVNACGGGGLIVEGNAAYGQPFAAASVSSMQACEPGMLGAGVLGNFAAGSYGGFEFLWLRANFGQNVALIIDPPVGNTLVPFDYQSDLSPRAWLGWQSCRGTGVRFTYFGFDDSADPVSVTAVAGATPVFVNVFGAGSNLTRNANANVGETLTSQHQLKLQTYDIEATQQFCFASTQAMFGLGVRIAEMDQLLRADVHDAGGAAQEAVTNDLEFRGAGPTASLWLTRPIMSSRLSFYSNLRGAFLIGDTDQRIYEMKGAYTTELEDRAVHREILTNAECSVGLQFGQSLTPRCGCFLRVGYEAQVWLDAGGPVNSDSAIGLDGVTFATGLAL